MSTPETIQLPSDDLLVLLTDALRAGPGSPEWSQAVKVLRSENQNVDEYTLLYRARERLEEGKEYRSVQAGPNFTRKVMDGIERQGPASPASLANIIALIAAGVILAAVVAVGVVLLRSGSVDQQQHALETLQNTIFGTRIVSADFNAGVPSDWRAFGDLSLAVDKGALHPAKIATTGPADAYRAGGWVIAEPISPDQTIKVAATCRAAKATDEGICQVFVSDEPITESNMAGGHALVYQLRAGESRAFLPDGKQAPQSEKAASSDLAVRIVLSRDLAIIEAGGKRLYAGPSQLSPTQGRFVGVRFLGRAGEKWDQLAVTSLTVQKP